jgi:outer membrane receptor protein involved in Fe transport
MIGISSVRNAVSSGVLGAVAISCVAAHGGDARAQEVLAANAGIVGEVIVTGTRRAERTVADSNVPVDVVSTQDLQLTAVADLANKLQGTVPSYNVKRLPLADGAIFVRPAALRGLSPDQTLVLVNGKRRHRSAFVDVTAQGAQAVDLAHIPQIALGRVEVLRDGASAQYGSDAIAGVINLILDDRPGFRSYTQWGEYAEGDGENIQAAAAGGIALGNGGSLNLSLEYVKADATSRSLQRPQAEALIALGEPYASHVHQPVVQRFGQPDLESYRSFYNASFDVGGTVEIYAFGNYARSEGINDFNWRAPAAAGGFAQSSAFNRSIYQDGPDAIFPDWDLRSIYPGGFTPRFGSKQDDYSTVVGVRGDLTPKLSWDASASYGYNKVEYFLHETINASLGPLSPTSFDAGSRDQAETNVNLEFVYEWDTVFAQPVNVAFGAEYRREKFGIQAGEPASYEVGPLRDLSPASNGFPGASPQQAGSWTRSNYALYVDLDTDVTARWNVGLAARFEDYDTFGSTADGKLSTRFKLSDALNLRAAVSTGFHAPTPGQANLTNTNQFPCGDSDCRHCRNVAADESRRIVARRQGTHAGGIGELQRRLRVYAGGGFHGFRRLLPHQGRGSDRTDASLHVDASAARFADCGGFSGCSGFDASELLHEWLFDAHARCRCGREFQCLARRRHARNHRRVQLQRYGDHSRTAGRDFRADAHTYRRAHSEEYGDADDGLPLECMERAAARTVLRQLDRAARRKPGTESARGATHVRRPAAWCGIAREYRSDGRLRERARQVS